MTTLECRGCPATDLLPNREPDQATSPDLAADQARGGPTKLKTVGAFLRHGTCSRTLMTVLDRELGGTLELEEAATDPHAGGLMRGYQCGMLWGATLAAGALAYRTYGAGPRAEAAAIRAAQRLVEAFRARHGHIDCLEITETDPQNRWQVFLNFFVKGGTFRCAARMARFAPDAFQAISHSFAAEAPTPPAAAPTAMVPAPAAAAPPAAAPTAMVPAPAAAAPPATAPTAPVPAPAVAAPAAAAPTAPAPATSPTPCRPESCAAAMARAMGASERHAVMAAGLAGGIGLSGGACGALGAAIWLLGMRLRQAGLATKAVNEKINALMERFIESSGYVYSCSTIVGRRFDDLDDHTAHLRFGGCDTLIDAVAKAAAALQEEALHAAPEATEAPAEA